MKKSLMLGLGFVFIFLFVQTFIFADSAGPVITNVKVTPHVLSITVLFKPISNITISSCSVVLNSSTGSFQGILNQVNNSAVNRILITSLSAQTSYQGKIVCFDSSKNIGESSVFTVVTNNRSALVGNNSVINQTVKTNLTNQTINNSSNSIKQPVQEGSSSMKKFVLGVSVGLGFLLIFGGIGYIIWKKRRN